MYRFRIQAVGNEKFQPIWLSTRSFFVNYTTASHIVDCEHWIHLFSYSLFKLFIWFYQNSAIKNWKSYRSTRVCTSHHKPIQAETEFSVLTDGGWWTTWCAQVMFDRVNQMPFNWIHFTECVTRWQEKKRKKKERWHNRKKNWFIFGVCFVSVHAWHTLLLYVLCVCVVEWILWI